MKKQFVRIISALLVMTVLFSCACLSASAAESNAIARLIGYDPDATGNSVTYDASSNTLTMKSRDSLRLTYTGELPEGAVVTWKTDDRDVAAIDADGKIETGAKCSIHFVDYIPVPYYAVIPGVPSTPTYRLPFLTFPYFEGKTTITMEVIDADGTLLRTDSVKLVVRHSFLDWILYRLTLIVPGRKTESVYA